MIPPQSRSWFNRFTKWAARAAGHPVAFTFAVLVVGLWLVTGPIFRFSDTWQLFINTATKVLTFLMVFLIQSTQYRDAEAVHIKLDELIRALDGAHAALLDLEELDEKDLARIRASYEHLAEQARNDLRRGKGDTGVREVES